MKRTAIAVAVVVFLVAAVLIESGPSQTQLHVTSGVPAEASTQPDSVTMGVVGAASDAQLLAWAAAEQKQRDIDAWNAGIQRAEDERREAEAAAAARSTATQQPARVAVAPNPPQASGSSAAPCGGAYPPCYVALRESGGNYGAFNPGGCYSNGRSGCYGKWQFGWFWGGKLGLPLDLAQATPAQQDEAARLLWNNGAGCSNWSAC